jgi:hypothetical protein
VDRTRLAALAAYLRELAERNLAEGQRIRPEQPSVAFELIDLARAQTLVAEDLCKTET